MRTEHNLTPVQLWTSCLQGIATFSNHIASEVFENIGEVGFLTHYNVSTLLVFTNNFQDEEEQFGIDWWEPVPHESTDEMVHVPETPIPLNSAEMEELQLFHL